MVHLCHVHCTEGQLSVHAAIKCAHKTLGARPGRAVCAAGAAVARHKLGRPWRTVRRCRSCRPHWRGLWGGHLPPSASPSSHTSSYHNSAPQNRAHWLMRPPSPGKVSPTILLTSSMTDRKCTAPQLYIFAMAIRGALHIRFHISCF